MSDGYQCTNCGEWYEEADELHGGLCDTCAIEASPSYMDLVAMVVEQRDQIQALQERVRALEAVTSQQGRMM